MVSAAGASTRDLVFISYSHADRAWLEWLTIFLKPYVRQGHFEVWADPSIGVGTRWKQAIAGGLARTCVGVLLVSPHFLASDFIHDEELPVLLEGAVLGQIALCPIPISASAYDITPLADIQWAHDPDTPLDSLSEAARNSALVGIVKTIHRLFAERAEAAAERTRPPVTPSPPPMPRTPTPQAPSPTPDAFAPAPDPFEEPFDPFAPSPDAFAVGGRLGALHGVPAQRPNYRRREAYFVPLKQALLGTAHAAVGIAAAVPQADQARLGLHGMGGIGKTVLAIDLAGDDDIRRAFPDGVFWLTLGQAPDPLALQAALIRFVTGKAEAVATVAEGRDRLRARLDGRACLLVLDDLWRIDDARAFDVLGPRSRLLTTTRNADLLVALGAATRSLDVLDEDSARDLLAAWSGQPRAALPDVAGQVARETGYLPLALALAGARARDGGRWDDVLAALRQGQLEFLDHPYGSVFTSLRLSTDALPAAEAARYRDLAAFPEDAAVPVETVCTLWRHTGGLAPHQSRRLLRDLSQRALLILDDAAERVSFHDLQHDFLRLSHPSLTKAHDALVEAYRAVCPDGWASGPDEGYFFPNIVFHLAWTGQFAEIAELISDLDSISSLKRLRPYRLSSLLAYALSYLPESFIQSSIKLKNMRGNERAIAECVCHIEFQSFDQKAQCKICKSKSIFHGHVDLGGVDYYDNYFVWCKNCLWAFHNEDWSQWGMDYGIRHFDYKTNLYI